MSDIFRPKKTRRVKVALQKGIARKNGVTNSVLRGTMTGQTPGRTRQPQQKCNEGRRNQDVGELLRLRKKRATRMLAVLRRNATLLRYQRPPVQQTMDWTLWRYE
jgi:hypothetical protein